MKRSLARLAGLAAASALCGPLMAQTTPVTPRTMIVMDGSGSMWGQIDGTPKLEIARQVVGQVLAGLSPDATLGLIAYGHRRRGDCSDIEVMVEPAPGTAAGIARAVNEMRFQGRTPLTESVRRAAEVLRWSEDPATVVLVTDGIETCEADPCALGRELEASGVNFTAHVVGFGLSAEEGAQVACLAEETGGAYFQADDAAGLTAALTATLAAEPAPEPEPEPVPQEPIPGLGPWYPGPAFQTGLQLLPTGQSRVQGVPEPERLDNFPADGTPEMCQAACAADSACTVWQFEPRGSYFVDFARCHLFGTSSEFDYVFEEGFVAGMTPGDAQLVRPFASDAPPSSPRATPLAEPASEPEPAPVEDARQGGPWFEGPAQQAGLQLWPTGRDLGITVPPVGEISFPADGTPQQCQALCDADGACRAWQFSPRGSYFIEEARCQLFDAGAELDYGFDAGFAAGLRAGALQLVRPFEAPATGEAPKN